jgi:hypothetical protein
MKKLAIAILGVLVLCTSCTDNIKLDFDNPTKEPQKITFDGKEFTLWALETVTKEVPRGEHTLQIGTDSVITYNFSEDEYLINPHRKSYVVENVQYSNAAFAGLQDRLNEVAENAAEYFGQSKFEVFDDLIKVRDWDFKQREKVPEEVTIKGDSYSLSTSLRKLYAPDELEELLEKGRRN